MATAAPAFCLRAVRVPLRVSNLTASPVCALFPKAQPAAKQSRALSSKPARSVHTAPSFIYSHHHSLKNSATTCLVSRAKFNSTTTAPPSSNPAQTSSQTPPNSEILTWDRYLQLRTVRRRYNTVASIVTALGTTALAAFIAVDQFDLENMGVGLFGLDPIVLLGFSTLACGATGWILGPFAGSAIFNVMNRRWVKLIGVREKDFYHRIRKHRVTPVGQSMNNPVPDYYGEKISSVKDYRRWLKDQRAFRKKSEIGNL